MPFSRRAEEAAKFLGTKIWGKTEGQAVGDAVRRGDVLTADANICTDNISMDEILWAIRKLKRRKAAGPDDAPIEFFKELEETALRQVQELLNEWWSSEDIPQGCKHEWCSYLKRVTKPTWLTTDRYHF